MPGRTPARDSSWIAARTGPTTPRRMSAMLDAIAGVLGRAPDDLALTKVARERDPFAVLVACLISLRTRDEVTDVAAARLLEVADDPESLARLPERRIERLIFPAGFYRTKARTLRALARTLIAEHGGRVPDSLEGLLRLKGVGRKTANLVITQGFGKPGICVDTHVHRVSNRVGFVVTATPDETELVLRALLPRRWWIPINDLLVSFGRTLCVPISPRCSECPLAATCPRVGVGRRR